MNNRINLFWDNSNIYIEGQKVCNKTESCNVFDFRIHFLNLFEFARNNRPISYSFVGGSIPPENTKLWKRFEDLNIELEIQERGEIGKKEIAVDEAIQLKIANLLLDKQYPETIILLTGDGAGYGDGKGFIKQLERALKKGWKIEVLSWDNSCNRFLKDFAKKNGIYIPLENAYYNITFINNKRWAKAILSTMDVKPSSIQP